MRMLRIAHRGASARRPENTVPAFVTACEDGADLVEMDVRETADHEWVLLHDADPARVTRVTGRILEMPLARWVEARDLELTTVFGLRSAAAIAEVKHHNPNIRVLGFIPRPHSAAGVDEFLDAGADVIRLWLDEVREDVVNRVHAAHKPVWVMAGDIGSTELQRLEALRCDGVLLNDPSVAR